MTVTGTAVRDDYYFGDIFSASRCHAGFLANAAGSREVDPNYPILTIFANADAREL